VTAKKLASATHTDSILSKLYQYVTKGWPRQVDINLKPFFDKKNGMTVEGGCVLWGQRVVIPQKWRQKLLQELHRDHPGVCKMKAIARSYIWWPGLNSSIERLAKECVDCQSVKNSPAVAPLHPWSWPSRVFQRIHIDFAGPFQGAMFLVVVDAFSKWPEAYIMQNTTTERTIEVLRHVFSAYGLPEQVVSDNGSQFTSEDFAVFMRMNGIKHTRSAPYHPSTNGLAERFVQSMKQALKTSQRSELSLSHRLHNFLMTYRTSVHSTTGESPASLFLKREVRTRFDLLRPSCESRVFEKQSQQKADHDQHARMRQFQIGSAVMAKDFRHHGRNWVPATVLERLGPLSYLVETRDHQVWRRHVDHLKSSGPATVPAVPQGQEGSDVWETPQAVDPDVENSDRQLPTGEQGEIEPNTESSADTVPEAAAPETAETPPTAVPEPRYPRREHAPPNYFRPCFN